MKTNPITIHQHLYQLYPDIPKFANDPQQSQIIRMYDLMLKRYQGIYGRQPKYFVRCPASFSVLGSSYVPVQMPVVSMSSLQNVIICISQNGHQQLRFNNYQNAVQSQKVLENESIKWKYDQKADQYSNLILCSLKMYSTMFNMHSLKGVDVLIFHDFIHDDHIHYGESLCLAIAAGLHATYNSKHAISSTINSQFCMKYLTKISNLVPDIKPMSYSLNSSYGKLTSINPNKMEQLKQIKWPQNIDIIVAHSMTPMPKKLIKGKRQNLRHCEILIGIQIVKNQLGAINNIKSLNQLATYLECKSISQLQQSIDQYLPKQNLSTQKIEQMTQKSLIDILKQVPYANNVIDENLTFKPYKRIQFYLQQQKLIEKLTEQNIVQTINNSYNNSKQLLQIGSEQIDDMIDIIKDLSLGWKIVGNGWGGYLLILCQSNKSKEILQELTNNFYMSKKNCLLLSDDIQQYIRIVGKPNNGLGILDPSSQIWY